ncbi:hypothetical protein [Streptomyces nigrescens]|uniref:hypothetical protein n=1 Tax=Streptomyces nigrescens TaxID=1920 RepID=UPI0036C5DEC7
MTAPAWAIVLALFIAAGASLALWARRRRGTGPLARNRARDADRALLRLARSEGRCPHGCTTCRVLTEPTAPKEVDQ